MNYNISRAETLTEFPYPDPIESTDSADSVPASTDHEMSHAQLPLKIVLPLISVILLTLLGVTLIIANVYKAKKDKQTSTNPLESLT